MAKPDPLSWISVISLEVHWDYGLFQAFVRIYLRSSPQRREQAKRALPRIEDDAVMWQALRGRERRN